MFVKFSKSINANSYPEFICSVSVFGKYIFLIGLIIFRSPLSRRHQKISDFNIVIIIRRDFISSRVYKFSVFIKFDKIDLCVFHAIKKYRCTKLIFLPFKFCRHIGKLSFADFCKNYSCHHLHKHKYRQYYAYDFACSFHKNILS